MLFLYFNFSVLCGTKVPAQLRFRIFSRFWDYFEEPRSELPRVIWFHQSIPTGFNPLKDKKTITTDFSLLLKIHK